MAFQTRWVPTEGNIAANVMALLRDINRSKEVQKLVLNDDCMYVSDKSGRWKNTNQGFFKLFLGCGYIWRLVELFFATLKANLYKPCLEDLVIALYQKLSYRPFFMVCKCLKIESDCLKGYSAYG